jgi:hypothetical protein
MHSHPNARRTPRGRAEVFELVEAGLTVNAGGRKTVPRGLP